MKQAKWMKWEPINDIPQTLYIHSLNFDRVLLTLKLYDKDINLPVLEINFEYCFVFRVMDESRFLKYSDDIDKSITNMNLDPGSIQKWSLYTVDNSRYLQWFHDESAGVYEDLNIVHYMISTPNDVVDVLYTGESDPPRVKFI